MEKKTHSNETQKVRKGVKVRKGSVVPRGQSPQLAQESRKASWRGDASFQFRGTDGIWDTEFSKYQSNRIWLVLAIAFGRARTQRSVCEQRPD